MRKVSVDQSLAMNPWKARLELSQVCLSFLSFQVWLHVHFNVLSKNLEILRWRAYELTVCLICYFVFSQC